MPVESEDTFPEKSCVVSSKCRGPSDGSPTGTLTMPLACRDPGVLRRSDSRGGEGGDGCAGVGSERSFRTCLCVRTTEDSFRRYDVVHSTRRLLRGVLLPVYGGRGPPSTVPEDSVVHRSSSGSEPQTHTHPGRRREGPGRGVPCTSYLFVRVFTGVPVPVTLV